MKRALVGLVLLGVVGVGALLWLTVSKIDGIVQQAIERYGSEIAGVPVRVGEVKIELSEGRGTIRGLEVANPPGFSDDNAFTLGEITLDIDTASLTQSPLRIDALRVAAPRALYELNAQGTSNIDVIRENVGLYTGSKGQSEETPGDEAEAAGEPMRLAVTEFRFEKGSVAADVSSILPDIGAQELELPSVTVRNIGGKEGATPDELGGEVLGAFAKAVRRAGRDLVKKETRKQFEKSLGGKAGKAAGELLDQLF